jgi:hypothetical protein
MTLLVEQGREDQQLARYLLGDMSDDEVEHIDERSIAEDGVAWRLRGIEDDLVDAYVTGELRGEALQRFKWFYLASERRREKVRFAENFQRAASRHARETTTQRRRWITPRFWGATLAVLLTLMLMVSGALLQQNVHLWHELQRTQAASAALEGRAHELERQLAVQRSITARMAHDLAQARVSLAEAIDRADRQPR